MTEAEIREKMRLLTVQMERLADATRRSNEAWHQSKRELERLRELLPDEPD